MLGGERKGPCCSKMGQAQTHVLHVSTQPEIPVYCPCIHLCNKYLLSVPAVPGVVPGIQDTRPSTTDKGERDTHTTND